MTILCQNRRMSTENDNTYRTKIRRSIKEFERRMACNIKTKWIIKYEKKSFRNIYLKKSSSEIQDFELVKTDSLFIHELNCLDKETFVTPSLSLLCILRKHIFLADIYTISWEPLTTFSWHFFFRPSLHRKPLQGGQLEVVWRLTK